MVKDNKKIWLNQKKVDDRPVYFTVKRITDIIFSLFGLIIAFPLFVVISIFIKFDGSNGKVLYAQNRLGYHGKKFKMYKFRSMIPDADKKLKDLQSKNEIDGAMFKMKDDPRVTKVGKIIRKYSLDELPQLLNVLIGDMSLVGPRPPLPNEVAEYTDYDKQRLLVKPGCTGLWQVSGRNDVDFDGMVNLDLKYIQSSNFFLDGKIMLETVKIMIFPNAAY